MPLALWQGNFVYIKQEYVTEEPHLIKCVDKEEDANLCVCVCRDCADIKKGKCLCIECACHELGKNETS